MNYRADLSGVCEDCKPRALARNPVIFVTEVVAGRYCDLHQLVF